MAWETLAPQVISRLSADLGLSPYQAAGIVGQLGHESGLQAINERQPVVPGSRGGFGWAQWTGPRRQQFEMWAQQRGADVADPETNYQFLLHELTQTPEGRVLADIRQAPDAQVAGRIFTDRFLRPGVPAYDSRASWTQKAMDFIMPTAQAGTLPQGMLQPGNIDLARRPVVRNADGTISTVRSMSANFDGREVLIPTVSEDGRIMSDDEAVEQYRKTGRMLGVFDNPDSATAYAQSLHNQQSEMYGDRRGSQSLAERIQRARDAGFNDEEILSRLQSNSDFAQRIQRARDAGFTDDEIFGRLGLQPQRQAQAAPAERSGVRRVGDAIMDIPRQVGLTARYGLEGLGQVAGVLTEPIRQGLNVGLRAAGLPEAAPTDQVARSAADAIGLPQPRNANERVVGDVTRLMAGAGGIAGGSAALARGATGATQAALRGLAAAPGQQIASAAGAGGAGGAVREAGGSPLAQAGASLLGGIAGPAALSGAQRAAGAVRQRLPGPISSVSPQRVEQRIELTMQQAGVDWSRVPERIRQQIRREAAAALRVGDDLDPAAMRRLLDFRRVEGATPTRGMLTQDPVRITREQNLARAGANSSDTGLQGLARVYNENNRALIGALDRMGASQTDDAYAAGQRAIGALDSRLRGQQARVNDLYSAARDSVGRSMPLDHRAFADRAIRSLEDNLSGYALPADVRNHINRISQGEVPFTVDYAEQLKSVIARQQRNTSDGATRYALGLVRQALDDTPVMGLGQQPAAAGARAVNPGNLPAVPGATGLGDDAVAAFTRARGANRSMMRQIERTPALKALYEGSITPDNFVSKYITGQGAKAADVQRLGRMLAPDRAARESIRGSIAQWLRDKALSDRSSEVGKFSAAAYERALKQLGDRKLRAFFEPQEIEQLRSIGRAASYMMNQPVGSAVNNSNTAGAVLGRALDATARLGSKVPLGLDRLISGTITGLQQGSAVRTPPALALPAPAVPMGQRILPPAVYGGLLSGAAIPPREDDRRP